MGVSYISNIQLIVDMITRGAWAATGIVVCWFVCLLPEARVGGHGYSSLLVCLFVTGISTHLDATALRLQHG